MHIHSPSRFLPGALCAMIGVVASLSCTNQAAAPGAADIDGAFPMIELELLTASDSYLVNQDVELRIRLTNNGNSVVQIPDPANSASPTPLFSLWRPGDDEPQRFSSATASGADPQSIASVSLVTIDPGNRLEHVLSLGSLTRLDHIGSYRLSAALEWKDMSASSEKLSFRIDPAAPTAVALGVGGNADRAEGEGAFFQGGKGNRKLYLFQYKETNPGILEAEADEPIEFVAVDDDATDLRVPWTSDSFFAEMSRYFVWRQGAAIKAVSNSVATPAQVVLDNEPAWLIAPVLKVPDGPIETLALSKSRLELTLVRFTPGGFADAPSGNAVWTTSLPQPVDATVAGLAPGSLSDTRHIGAVHAGEGGIDIYHASFDADGPPAAFGGVHVAGVSLIEGADPGLFVDADGAAHISVLVRVGKEPDAAGLVEAAFDADGSPREPASLTPLGTASAPVVGGAIVYAHDNGVRKRLDVVLLAQDGLLYKSAGDGNLIEVAVQGKATRPIQLAPGRDVSYVLYSDPGRGFYLEAL